MVFIFLAYFTLYNGLQFHPSNTIHKNKLKMDKRSKCKTRNYKTPRGEHRENTLRHKSQQDPLYYLSSHQLLTTTAQGRGRNGSLTQLCNCPNSLM